MTTSASGSAARIRASISAAGIAMFGASGLAHQLAARFDVLLFEHRAHTGFVDVDAGTGEVAKHLADHVLVSRFLEVSLNHGLPVRFRLFGSETHLLRRPLAEQAVAAGSNAERGLRVHCELAFLASATVVEIVHDKVP